MDFRFDAIVVGGGHNGLVAAAYLAGFGQRVLILEGSEEVGGATKSQRVFPDYDVRVSRYSYLISLLPPEIIRELKLDFKVASRRIASYTCYEDKNGHPRGLILSNEDPSLSRESLRVLDPCVDSWREYTQFGEVQQEIAKLVWPTLTQPLLGKDEFLKRLDTTAKRNAWDAVIEKPLGVFLEKTISNDTLRGLLFTDAKIGVFTEPHDESLLQNRCFLYHVIGQGNGEWKVPIGGMGALVYALVARCESRGVKILTRSPAIRIESEGQEHTVVVESQGKEVHYSATRVFITSGPRTQRRLLGYDTVEKSEDEGSVAKVNMLLKRLPRLRTFDNPLHPFVSSEDAFTGSLHVDESYAAMLVSHGQASKGVLPDRPPFEVYCHSLTDSSIMAPSIAEQGWHTLTLFGLDVPYRVFAPDNASRRDELLQRYYAAFNRICDEPFEDCLATDKDGNPCIEIKTAIDLENEIGLDQGNIFHNAPSWFFATEPELEGKWGCETTQNGIYLAGSSAKRGGAVSGIPGRNAVASALGIDSFH